MDPVVEEFFNPNHDAGVYQWVTVMEEVESMLVGVFFPPLTPFAMSEYEVEVLFLAKDVFAPTCRQWLFLQQIISDRYVCKRWWLFPYLDDLVPI